MRIPIKRYVLTEDLRKIIEAEASDMFGPPNAIAVEYLKLLSHHEEETRWMADRIKELELLTKD